MGYDVHQLVKGRDLWMGGIKLEHEMGLLGHSDADVLIHAICDAILGAANMRDIGYHFPDTSAETEGMDSKIILAWHQVTITAANTFIGDLLGKTKGVNVVSPTWFALKGNEGDYVSYAERSYVERMHSRGIQVWALVDNFGHDFSSDVDVEEILSRTSVREKLTESLVRDAEELGIDGINLDFEMLPSSAGVHYIQFIREMSIFGEVKYYDFEPYQTMVYDLRSIGQNVNQIARVVNSTGSIYERDIRDLKAEIKKLEGVFDAYFKGFDYKIME